MADLKNLMMLLRKEAEEIYFGEFSRPNSVAHYNKLSSSDLKADDHDDIISMS